MVNNRIVSRYEGELPTGAHASREIAGGSLYPVDEILSILDAGGSDAIRTWTQKCIEDMQKWSLDDDDVHELIKIAVRGGRFIGSEWCQQNKNGPWAACDAYQVTRNEWLANARKYMDIDYYLKFAIGKLGNLLLVVSCHPTEDRS